MTTPRSEYSLTTIEYIDNNGDILNQIDSSTGGTLTLNTDASFDVNGAVNIQNIGDLVLRQTAAGPGVFTQRAATTVTDYVITWPAAQATTSNQLLSNNGSGVLSWVNPFLPVSLSWKQAVRVATTAPGTLATSFENGDTIDGVVIATGNRILIKNQANGIENGIYTVNATGAPSRTTDFAIGFAAAGAALISTEGTDNADLGWVCTTDAPNDIVGTNSLVFENFSNINPVIVAGVSGDIQLNDGSNPANLAVGTTSIFRYTDGASSSLTVGNTSTNTFTLQGTAANGNNQGTDVDIVGGNGSGTGTGGFINITGGAGTSGSQNGDINITGGAGTAVNSRGGSINITGGESNTSRGGNMFITSGFSLNDGDSGNITLNTEFASGTGNSGRITISTGNSANGETGDLILETGTSTGVPGTFSFISGGVLNTKDGFVFENSAAVALVGIREASQNSVSTSTGTMTIKTGGLGVAGDIHATTFNASSDINLKTNIQPIDNPLDQLLKIEGYTYEWNGNSKRQMGVIAQQLEEIGLGDIVSGEDTKSVNYNALIPLIIESIKEIVKNKL
jgi:hypothetical protein